MELVQRENLLFVEIVELFILFCHTLMLYKHHNKKSGFAGKNNC